MADDPRHHLSIYLNDHHAGSTLAIELLHRAVNQYEGTELGTFFTEIRTEIEEDRDTLKELMAANGVKQDEIKMAMAWVAEKAGRLKFNGAVLRRSALTPLVELETLTVGINGKLLLWKALKAQPADAASEARLDELIARADSQLERVEHHRVQAARRALSPAQVR